MGTGGTARLLSTVGTVRPSYGGCYGGVSGQPGDNGKIPHASGDDSPLAPGNRPLLVRHVLDRKRKEWAERVSRDDAEWGISWIRIRSQYFERSVLTYIDQAVEGRAAPPDEDADILLGGNPRARSGLQ